MKHFISGDDFTKEKVEAIAGLVLKVKNMPLDDINNLCRGRVVGSLFFEESVRSSALVKAAIVKMGGGYIDLPSVLTEDETDVILSLAPFCDLLVLRSSKTDIMGMRETTLCPVINALCSGSAKEHMLSAVWQLAALLEMGILKRDLKVGIYGQTAHCRPYMTLQKILSFYGAKIYHDPVLDALKNPDDVSKGITQNGGAYTVLPYEEFRNDVDILLIPDGMPMSDEYHDVFTLYAEKYKTIAENDIADLPRDIKINYMMPRKMIDGRLTVSQSADRDKRIYNSLLMQEGIWGTMALYLYCLGIDL